MKIEEIQAQLDGKMYWDASETEIREWLSGKHGISEEQADEMVAEGNRAKAAAIRKKSMVHLVLGLGASAVFGFLLWVIHLSERTMLIWEFVIGGALVGCLLFSGRSLMRILTGNSDTAIDA